MVKTKSPANIAFIKYWGQQDKNLCTPYNTSISMTLDQCISTCEVDFIDQAEDILEVEYYQKTAQRIIPQKGAKSQYIFDHIDRIRNLAVSNSHVHIRASNTFPESCGIASSASSFSAMTLALCKIFDLQEYLSDQSKLSKLIRLSGSGSAVRSAFGGFVEFRLTDLSEASRAFQIADETHWDLCDIVCVVQTGQKKVSSTAGHQLATSSPYFQTRIDEMQSRIVDCKKAIIDKDFSLLGRCIEEDSISMHLIMMTSKPPIFYWTPSTMAVIHLVYELREQGIECYHTIDAGCNVHVICEEKNVETLQKKLLSHPSIQNIIINRPCPGVSFV